MPEIPVEFYVTEATTVDAADPILNGLHDLIVAVSISVTTFLLILQIDQIPVAPLQSDENGFVSTFLVQWDTMVPVPHIRIRLEDVARNSGHLHKQ